MPVKPPPTATLPKEPWADVEDALRDRIEVALEHGDPIPEPPYALGGRPPECGGAASRISPAKPP